VISDNINVGGIRPALLLANNNLQSTHLELVSKLNAVNSRLNDVVKNANALNSAENTLMATIQSLDATGTILALNGANMLSRELDLLQLALATNPVLPTVNQLPQYEVKWFSDRVAAFFAYNKPSPTNARVSYNNANDLFVSSRRNRQKAAIQSYVANALPNQTITSPVSSQFIAEQAQKIAEAMPIFAASIMGGNNLNVEKEIAIAVSTYVLGRSQATNPFNNDPAAFAAAINNYQELKNKEAAAALSAANASYGIVSKIY
jgi:hypothetical protein